MDNPQAEVSSMARIRSIKPEFWTSEQVMESSPLARLLFLGIWNFCDDSGVHPLKPVSLKALIFPGDDIDSTTIRRLLDELSKNGLVVLYAVGEKEYLQVTGWHHQRIDKPTFKFPTAENGIPLKTKGSPKKIDEPSNTTRGLFVEDSGTERIGVNQEHSIKFDKSASFATFWKLYPRKVGKAAAEKKFETKCKDQDTFERIIASVGDHIVSAWNLKEMNFIPHAATWLNQERWNDEVSHVRPNPTPPNGSGNSASRPSLSDQVRIANEARARELGGAEGQGTTGPTELPEAGMGEGDTFAGEFARIDPADGKIVDPHD